MADHSPMTTGAAPPLHEADDHASPTRHDGAGLGVSVGSRLAALLAEGGSPAWPDDEVGPVPTPHQRAEGEEAALLAAVYERLTTPGGAGGNKVQGADGGGAATAAPPPLLDDIAAIFRHYVAIGDKLNASTLSHANFVKLARDCGWAATPTAAAQCDVLYTRVIRGDAARYGILSLVGEDKGVTVETTFPWLLARVGLWLWAQRVPAAGAAGAPTAATTTHPPSAPLVDADGVDATADRVVALLRAGLSHAKRNWGVGDPMDLPKPSAIHALTRAQPILQRIFHAYATGKDGSGTKSMDFPTWSRVCCDFNLCPGVISKPALFAVFNAVNPQRTAVLYPGYLEAMGRLALTVFGTPAMAPAHPSPGSRIDAMMDRVMASADRLAALTAAERERGTLAIPDEGRASGGGHGTGGVILSLSSPASQYRMSLANAAMASAVAHATLSPMATVMSNVDGGGVEAAGAGSGAEAMSIMQRRYSTVVAALKSVGSVGTVASHTSSPHQPPYTPTSASVTRTVSPHGVDLAADVDRSAHQGATMAQPATAACVPSLFDLALPEEPGDEDGVAVHAQLGATARPPVPPLWGGDDGTPSPSNAMAPPPPQQQQVTTHAPAAGPGAKPKGMASLRSPKAVVPVAKSFRPPFSPTAAARRRSTAGTLAKATRAALATVEGAPPPPPASSPPSPSCKDAGMGTGTHGSSPSSPPPRPASGHHGAWPAKGAAAPVYAATPSPTHAATTSTMAPVEYGGAVAGLAPAASFRSIRTQSQPPLGPSTRPALSVDGAGGLGYALPGASLAGSLAADQVRMATQGAAVPIPIPAAAALAASVMAEREGLVPAGQVALGGTPPPAAKPPPTGTAASRRDATSLAHATAALIAKQAGAAVTSPVTAASSTTAAVGWVVHPATVDHLTTRFGHLATTLEPLFLFYARIGDPGNTGRMSHTNFYRLLRDVDALDGAVTTGAVNLQLATLARHAGGHADDHDISLAVGLCLNTASPGTVRSRSRSCSSSKSGGWEGGGGGGRRARRSSSPAVGRASAMTGHGMGLTLPDFVEALARVSELIRHAHVAGAAPASADALSVANGTASVSPSSGTCTDAEADRARAAACFHHFLHHRILPLLPVAAADDRCAALVDAPEVVDAVAAQAAFVKRLFAFYANEQREGGGVGVYLPEFTHFAKDFGIFPTLLNQQGIEATFYACARRAGTDLGPAGRMTRGGCDGMGGTFIQHRRGDATRSASPTRAPHFSRPPTAVEWESVGMGAGDDGVGVASGAWDGMVDSSPYRDGDTAFLTFPSFAEAIARMALVGFSKPYLNRRYPAPADKVVGLFTWCAASQAMTVIQAADWTRGRSRAGRQLTRAQLAGTPSPDVGRLLLGDTTMAAPDAGGGDDDDKAVGRDGQGDRWPPAGRRHSGPPVALTQALMARVGSGGGEDTGGGAMHAIATTSTRRVRLSGSHTQPLPALLDRDSHNGRAVSATGRGAPPPPLPPNPPSRPDGGASPGPEPPALPPPTTHDQGLLAHVAHLLRAPTNHDGDGDATMAVAWTGGGGHAPPPSPPTAPPSTLAPTRSRGYDFTTATVHMGDLGAGAPVHRYAHVVEAVVSPATAVAGAATGDGKSRATARRHSRRVPHDAPATVNATGPSTQPTTANAGLFHKGEMSFYARQAAARGAKLTSEGATALRPGVERSDLDAVLLVGGAPPSTSAHPAASRSRGVPVTPTATGTLARTSAAAMKGFSPCVPKSPSLLGGGHLVGVDAALAGIPIPTDPAAQVLHRGEVARAVAVRAMQASLTPKAASAGGVLVRPGTTGSPPAFHTQQRAMVRQQPAAAHNVGAGEHADAATGGDRGGWASDARRVSWGSDDMEGTPLRLSMLAGSGSGIGGRAGRRGSGGEAASPWDPSTPVGAMCTALANQGVSDPAVILAHLQATGVPLPPAVVMLLQAQILAQRPSAAAPPPAFRPPGMAPATTFTSTQAKASSARASRLQPRPVMPPPRRTAASPPGKQVVTLEGRSVPLAALRTPLAGAVVQGWSGSLRSPRVAATTTTTRSGTGDHGEALSPRLVVAPSPDVGGGGQAAASPPTTHSTGRLVTSWGTAHTSRIVAGMPPTRPADARRGSSGEGEGHAPASHTKDSRPAFTMAGGRHKLAPSTAMQPPPRRSSWLASLAAATMGEEDIPTIPLANGVGGDHASMPGAGKGKARRLSIQTAFTDTDRDHSMPMVAEAV